MPAVLGVFVAELRGQEPLFGADAGEERDQEQTDEKQAEAAAEDEAQPMRSTSIPK